MPTIEKEYTSLRVLREDAKRFKRIAVNSDRSMKELFSEIVTVLEEKGVCNDYKGNKGNQGKSSNSGTGS